MPHITCRIELISEVPSSLFPVPCSLFPVPDFCKKSNNCYYCL
ncbi:hypothetical protein BJP36_36105 [Moorena producens JHB]|uniref:Uncharacterized protein n=1 Tax=Moorena producens (strain JHB) TaxID=1454205 RepID=A0A9Q9STV4_MOOP1|nr:hypothetical protein [Moorena producens]WAN69518.1 hypothetical protein BJP36_36105 [Moorena producens JHB]